MIFRRRRSGQGGPDGPAGSQGSPESSADHGADISAESNPQSSAESNPQSSAESGAESSADPDSPGRPAAAPDRSRGPWDVSEVDGTEEDPTYVDLGGLLVKGRPGLELRLNSDRASGQIVAVLLAAQDGALEIRAFAAPRSGNIWDDVRADIVAEAKRLGGGVRERDGEYGPELDVVLPVAVDDGRQASQPSRIVGVQGPRWLLRGTFLGRPAVQPDPGGLLESALRDVVVVRGGEPMAPREALPLRLPSDARPYTEPPPDAPPASTLES